MYNKTNGEAHKKQVPTSAKQSDSQAPASERQIVRVFLPLGVEIRKEILLVKSTSLPML